MIIYEVIFLTLIAALLSSFAQLSFKKGVNAKIKSVKGLLSLVLNKNVVAGLILYFVGFVLYLVALKAGELSIVYPVFASSFVFVTILSAFMLKEKITAIRAVGVLFVFLGIAIVAIS